MAPRRQYSITIVFPRIVAVIMNNFFGLQVVNYFDDSGCPLPGPFSKPGLMVFSIACREIGVLLNDLKFDIAQKAHSSDYWGPSIIRRTI